MGLYINGMEMPTGNNAVSIIIFPNGKVSLAHDHRFAEYAEAVPVPPHGRLGDLDALLKKCEFVCTDDDEDTRAVRYSIIEDAPTIIPASFENPTKNARYSQDNPAEEGE